MNPFPAFLAGRIVLLLALTGILFSLALGRPLSRRGRTLLFVVLAGALLSYPNFGLFHVYQYGTIHYWDAYHYFMGSKYLPELGYFKLYEATYLAGRELGAFADVPYVRDLPTYRGRWVSSIDGPAVRARFSPDRWEMFKRDLAFFLPRVTKWRALFLDHGNNDPPPRALLMHALLRWVPASPLTLGVLTSLDYLLMAVAFGFVWWAFGAVPAAVSIAFLTLSFFGRFDFIGGSILRWDWIAALLVGVAAFARGFGSAAGVLFAYMVVARIFPALLLVPLGIKWLHGRFTGTVDRALTRCVLWAIGLALAVTLTFAALGFRVAVVPEYLAKLQVHSQSASTNRVGLGSVLITSAAVWIENPDGTVVLDEETVPAARPAPYVLPLVSALYLLVALPLIFRAGPLEGMMYGVPLIFCAISLASYYYAFLVLLVLLPWGEGSADRARLVEMTLLGALTVVSYGFELRSSDFMPLFYKVSIQTGLFFVVWIAVEYARLHSITARPSRRW
ncbi:MAG: hypothetical protein ACREJS_04170 [Candidatus Rokuibacteriota bacterium]